MKARIRTFIENIFFTPKPLPGGSYQGYYILPDGQTCRLHLRLEPSGEGLLVINASTILHLNPSASEFAYHIIKGSPEDVITAEMVKRYRATAEQVKTDLDTFIGRLESLLLMPDLDPESFLDFERIELHQDHLAAPLRLDCALTYQAPEETSAVYAPVNRVKRLLETEEWKTILQKAWEKGILHVVFTGGEPTLRPDLQELIAHAEQLGLVAGLITSGSRLSEKGYLEALLQAGLDHIMLVLDPKDGEAWEVLTDIVHEDISLTVHLTISKANFGTIESVLKKLEKANVKNISISLSDEIETTRLAEISRKIHESNLSLVEDLPVPYSEMNPIGLEVQDAENSLKGAARSWLYVEPDGDVLPAQGITTVLGNFLTDPWEKIWSAAKIWVNETK